MATKAKQNGTVKRVVASKKEEVTKKIEEKATASTVKEQPVKKAEEIKASVIEAPKPKTLEQRLGDFERMKGLAAQRERLATTLTDLKRFKYQNADSSSFHLRDENGEEFKTTNNNLIQLVTDVLQDTLETRKSEIEKDILEFDL